MMDVERVPWEIEANGLKEALLTDWVRENYHDFPKNLKSMFYDS